MQTYITKNGQQYGPYSDSEVAEYLKTGQISENDFAWQEGLPEWVPLSQLFAVQLSNVPSPPPLPVTVQAPSLKGFSNEEILQIAKLQKTMIWLILASLIAAFIPFAPIVTGILALI
jgi:hypothetical protein